MSRGSSALAPALALLMAASSLVSTARAQPTDAPLAEQLFDEAKRLMEAQRYDEACPKFAESHRLDPAGGTILLLAQCHEAQGKLATAWAEYKESLARARDAGNTRRERISRERIAVIEPLLSTLTILVPPEVSRLPGFRLMRGGVALAPVLWGTAMNVDPGFYELQASADGHDSWSSRVEVGPRADRASVTIPLLQPRPEAAPPASSTPVAPPAPPASSTPVASSQPAPTAPPAAVARPERWPAFVALGLGAAGLGLGAYFGLRSFSDARHANERCPERTCNDAGAVRRGNDAVREANLSNVAFGLGLVATGVGAYLWFSTPAPSPPGTARLQWSPSVAPGHFTMSGRVSW